MVAINLLGFKIQFQGVHNKQIIIIPAETKTITPGVYPTHKLNLNHEAYRVWYRKQDIFYRINENITLYPNKNLLVPFSFVVTLNMFPLWQ